MARPKALKGYYTTGELAQIFGRSPTFIRQRGCKDAKRKKIRGTFYYYSRDVFNNILSWELQQAKPQTNGSNGVSLADRYWRERFLLVRQRRRRERGELVDPQKILEHLAPVFVGLQSALDRIKNHHPAAYEIINQPLERFEKQLAEESSTNHS